MSIRNYLKGMKRSKSRRTTHGLESLETALALKTGVNPEDLKRARRAANKQRAEREQRAKQRSELQRLEAAEAKRRTKMQRTA